VAQRSASDRRPEQRAHTAAGDAFPQEAFAHLAELEDGHFWFRSRNRLITWALSRYFPETETLLEVGCGTGVVLASLRRSFPSMRLVGADISGEALRVARERVDADFLEVDALQARFSEPFDVVSAFDVLEHIDDDEGALERLAAAARPRGGLLVTVPQYRWLWSAGDDYGRHRRRYTKREIDRKVERAGFEIVKSTAWVSTLLPVVALSRRRDRRTPEAYDPTRELRVPRRLNRALELALDAELAVIRRGVSLPFGSSRLVIAVKR
jgi:SAM-dependent methyltransferase